MNKVNKNEEFKKLAKIIDQGIDNDFLNWESELKGYGARYFMTKFTKEGEAYIGERSKSTNLKSGRGISAS